MKDILHISRIPEHWIFSCVKNFNESRVMWPVSVSSYVWFFGSTKNSLTRPPFYYICNWIHTFIQISTKCTTLQLLYILYSFSRNGGKCPPRFCWPRKMRSIPSGQMLSLLTPRNVRMGKRTGNYSKTSRCIYTTPTVRSEKYVELWGGNGGLVRSYGKWGMPIILVSASFLFTFVNLSIKWLKPRNLNKSEHYKIQK